MQKKFIFLNSDHYTRTVLRTPPGGLGRHVLLTRDECNTLVEEGASGCESIREALDMFTFDITEENYHSASVGEKPEIALVLSLLVRFGVIAP